MLNFLFNNSFIPLVSKNKVGFRLSLVDTLVIIITLMITYFYPKGFLDISLLDNFFHYAPLFVVANFFLFCNVFRIRTQFELIWIGLSAMNVMAYLLYYQNTFLFFLIQLLFTSFSVALELKSIQYHGIFAQKINSFKVAKK